MFKDVTMIIGFVLILIGVVLTALFLMTGRVLAEESESMGLTKAAAHFGTSYVITHATEVVCTKAFGKENKLACTVAGAVTSAAAGAFKEHVLDHGGNHTRAYVANVAGIATAVTLISIDW